MVDNTIDTDLVSEATIGAADVDEITVDGDIVWQAFTGAVWTTENDWNSLSSETGIAHESVADTDHTDAESVKRGYSINSPYLSSSLVAYWPLHETSGSTAYDFSGNENHGTVGSNTTQDVSGPLDATAYDFHNNSGAYIDIPRVIDGGSGMTISTWVYFNDMTSGRDDFMSVSSLDMRFVNYHDENPPEVGVRAHDGSSAEYLKLADSQSVSTNTWHLMTATWDGSTMRGYWDGSESDVSAFSPVSPNRRPYLGRNLDDNERTLDGRMAEVMVFNRALSASEVQYLYDVVNTAGTFTTDWKGVR